MSTSSCRVSTLVALGRHALFVLVAALLPALAFAQNGTVTGTVTNSATGLPVQNVNVSLCTETGGCFSGPTNASGVYSRSVPAGTYYAYTSNSGLVNEIFDNLQCPGSACQTANAIATGTPIAVGAGATVSGRDFALDPGGSISGTVIDAATGAPVASVTVFIQTRAGSSSALSNSATTNASGVYTVGGLPTGAYFAYTANTVGYTNEIYDNVLCVYSCSSFLAVQSGTPIAVTSGAAATGINFTLDVGGRITGSIVSAATGTPVPNAFVQVYTQVGDFLNFVTGAQANTSGVYTVTGLPTATYYVATSTSNFVDELYNNIPCAGSCNPNVGTPGTPIPVRLGVTSGGIDFQLDTGGSITGTITDAATSLPVPNVSVSVYQQTGTNAVTNVGSDFTDAAGVYTVSGLTTGTYFAATSTSFVFTASYINEVFNNVPCPGSCPTSVILTGTPIAVTSGAVTPGRDFALNIGGSITGTVTNAATSAPLQNISIQVYSRVGTTSVFAGSGFSTSTGAWTVTGLPTGTYFAFTSASTALRLDQEIFNNIACPTTCSPGTATSTGTPINVTAGATTGGVGFTLSPSTLPHAPSNFGARVDNFVAQFSWFPASTGGLPTSYVIEAGLTSGQTIVTFTTTQTTFDIPGVPPGQFYLRVRAVNAFGTSPPSNEYVLIVNPDGSGRLGAPQSLSARMNGSRLTMTWADPTFGGVPRSYILEVGSAQGLSNIVTLPVAFRNFTFEPVPDGVYFIRVRARHGAQIGPPSAEVMLVVGNVPSPPSAPRSLFHTLLNGVLTLTWSAPLSGTPTKYLIEAGTASGLSNIAVFDTNSTALTASFPGVPTGTYYVRVRAVSALGSSVASNERTIIVP